jgi:hypothetical protein
LVTGTHRQQRGLQGIRHRIGKQEVGGETQKLPQRGAKSHDVAAAGARAGQLLRRRRYGLRGRRGNSGEWSEERGVCAGTVVCRGGTVAKKNEIIRWWCKEERQQQRQQQHAWRRGSIRGRAGAGETAALDAASALSPQLPKLVPIYNNTITPPILITIQRAPNTGKRSRHQRGTLAQERRAR